MSRGYSVFIVKDNLWNEYSFFEEDESADATHLAAHVQNSYAAVAVLWHTRMDVSYFYSKNGISSKSYGEIKTAFRNKTPVEAASNKLKDYDGPLHAMPTASSDDPQLKARKKQNSMFDSEESKQTALSTLGCLVVGCAVSAALPLLMPDASPLTKTAYVLTGFLLSVLSALAVYLVMMTSKQGGKAKGLAKEYLGTFNQTHALKTGKMTDTDLFEDFFASPEEKKPRFEDERTLPFADSIFNKKKQTEESDHAEGTAQEDSEADEQTNETFEQEQALQKALEKFVEEISRIRALGNNDTLDEDEAFAFTLYVLGAARAISEGYSIAPEHIATTVPLMLTRINIPPAKTADVIEHLNEYTIFPRYKDMLNYGYNDTQSMLGDESAMFFGLQEALQRWISDSEKHRNDGSHKFMAVMFTDIENFTEQTSSKGETWMMNTLTAHNSIVRKVIEELNGTEIKHTGDGILASFSMVKNAVTASQMIEKSIKTFSEKLPDQAFSLRIGIASGEVVTMENDIFGDAVNMAARIVDVAKSNRTYTDENTKNIASQQGIKFKDRGSQDLKGLGATVLFMVDNREG